MLVESGSPNPEIAHRIAQMRRGLRPIQTAIGKRKQLDVSIKTRYTDAFALSKMWFNAAVWEPLPKRAHCKVAAAQATAYRAALGRPLGGSKEDLESHAK
eukprot:3678630-Pyramimonas_sp.AAC.1